MICYACSRVIASAWFNLKELPEEVVPLLKKAEHAVFNADKISSEELQRLKQQFKVLNDRVMADNEEAILGTDNYLKYLLDSGRADSLKNLNALSALVVEGNITTLITCAVTQLASSKELQRQLRESLNEVNLGNAKTLEEFSHELKKCEFLNNIYLEALRFFAPAPPVVRYCSKTTNIGGVTIPARSFVFVPFRRILHDATLWNNPEVFDPSRPQHTKMKANVYPFNPFSMGQRVCPASFGFAEAMFKVALISLFKDNELSLTSHDAIEAIPVTAKEPRLQQEYYATLDKVDEDQNKPYIPAYYARRSAIRVPVAKATPQEPVYEADNEFESSLYM
jgi:cytochrome P450